MTCKLQLNGDDYIMKVTINKMLEIYLTIIISKYKVKIIQNVTLKKQYNNYIIIIFNKIIIINYIRVPI